LVEIGKQVVASIYTGDRDDPVLAKAEVARRAVAERGGVNGFGIRFLSIAADGQQRIEAVLKEALGEFLGV
jgi:hypothetical protein